MAHAPVELVLVASQPLLERLAIRQGLRLQRGPGTDLAAARTTGEVGIRLLVLQLACDTFHAHLHALAQLLPVEAQGDLRVRLDLAALVALVIGVEAEAAFVDAFQQHDARGDATGAVDGGQVHRRGFTVAAGAGFAEQPLKSTQDLGVEHGV